ncbi:ParB N-terminal domain-containing protein [Eubacteriales bacterium OttesenSCG-928-A19]|nr:ParB N-terminal domain-containing protein [Eubacteriales bacterium OttesenSCG-928-A19]
MDVKIISKVKQVPVDRLVPYERNPRKNDGAVDAVAASIRRFGFLVPMVISSDNVIVAGHTRLKAAQKLGMKTVPCVIAEELTEEEMRAFRLADNKVAEIAEWDGELLPLELADITLDMTDFGFAAITEDDFGEDFTLDSGDKKPFQQISLTLHDEQAELLLSAIQYVYDNDMVQETFGNDNHNGNGIYEVVRQWAAQKKL